MSDINDTSVVLLAAGQGTRLNNGQPSSIPKVMHKICDRPMLWYTLNTLKQAGFADIAIVVGYQADMIQKEFGDEYKYAVQSEQKGTGHAVLCAEQAVNPDSKHVLVIQGDDSAFYRPITLQNLVETHVEEGAKVSLLTLDHPKPGELGRIIRGKDGKVIAIKEKEVLTDEEKNITEINTGTYCFEAPWLWEHLKKLEPSATGKGELILPDLIKMSVDERLPVSAHMISDLDEWVGINTPEQLARANRMMSERM